MKYISYLLIIFILVSCKQKNGYNSNEISYQSKNKITILRIIEDHLNNPEEVKELYLNGSNVEEIPDSIARFRNLEVLTLSNIRFKRFPKTICQLKKLKKLVIGYTMDGTSSIYGTFISEIPHEIAQLSQLKELYLNGCEIEKLPPEIGKLTRLRVLELNRNKLTYLPKEITYLKKLEVLGIDSNEIKDFPPDMNALQNLKHINYAWNEKLSYQSKAKLRKDLPNCSFPSSSIEDALKYPGQVYHLHVEIDGDDPNNDLIKYFKEKIISKLVRLESLSIMLHYIKKKNKIESIRKLDTIIHSLKGLKKLKHIYLDFNKDFSFPISLTELKDIRSLNITGSWIESIPQEISQLKKLEVLNLQDNHKKNKSNIGEIRNFQLDVELLTKNIKFNPNNPILYNKRAVAYFNLSQYELAIQDLNKAIKLKPDYAMAYYNRGAVYYRIKKRYYGNKDYHKAIMIDPNLADHHYNDRFMITEDISYFDLIIFIILDIPLAYLLLFHLIDIPNILRKKDNRLPSLRFRIIVFLILIVFIPLLGILDYILISDSLALGLGVGVSLIIIIFLVLFILIGRNIIKSIFKSKSERTNYS